MVYLYILVYVFFVYLLLKKLSIINYKEYQGFTTRFFNKKVETIEIHSVIFWIFLTPIVSVIAYIVGLFLFPKNIDISQLWLLSPFFWTIEIVWLLLIERSNLINKLFLFLIVITSTLLNLYISKLIFTGDLSDLLPDSGNTIWQIYSLIFIFLVTLIKTSYDREDYDTKRTNHIKSKLNYLKARFSILKIVDGDLEKIILAILIKEDFERPPFLRIIEKIVHSKMRNIAQNDSINDEHSIYLLIKKVKFELFKVEDCNRDCKYKKIIKSINDSDDYYNDAIYLYHIICSLEEKKR